MVRERHKTEKIYPLPKLAENHFPRMEIKQKSLPEKSPKHWKE